MDSSNDRSGSAPTLAAVAERAGVSPITVSRVLRLPHLVSPRTRETVQAAMNALGYVPNLVAGSLASARTRSVGVLVPTIANSIFADTVQGLSDRLEPLGLAVILAQSRYDAEREDHIIAALLARRPEAIIMVGSPATRVGDALLRRAGIPVVETWDLPANPIDAAAGFDNYAAGVTVAEHLIAQGRRRLAFIGGQDPRATRRWLGFARTARRAGLPAPERHVLPRETSGAIAALPALRQADAVFAANDALAIALCSTLRDSGRLLSGPASAQPVAVVGLGDLEMGRLISPRLSTIRVHGAEIGHTAAELTLDSSGARKVDLGFDLVVRDSG
jgi:LacI family gluconate utilization system Gnt-I transcriptional repressor